MLIFFWFGAFCIKLISAQDAQSFDFIVAGAGTAGCVIASRLSENGKFSVLLLETGNVPHSELDVPALAVKHTLNPEFAAVYESVPQKNANLKYGGIVTYSHGRTLGGTSSINYMYFNRGNPHDFDHWANLTGDSSWRYSNLLKYFKKSENYFGDFPSDQHGHDGPITVSRPKYAPGLDIWLQAGKDLRYEIVDPNGPQRVSFTPAEYSKKSGKRVSAYTGYIKPYIDIRMNLKVITNAEVEQIVFEGTRAIGVKYVTTADGGSSVFVKADMEVIVCGGVIGSPVLLMKSGVGPKDELEEGKIFPVKYLPVGRNLQDHTTVKMEFVINDKSTIFDGDVILSPETRKVYDEFGEGPYSSTYGYTGQAFLSTTFQQKTDVPDWPDIQYMFMSSHDIPGLFPPIFDDIDLKKDEAVISCNVLLARPRSRGTVTLNKINIRGPALIDFQYLTDPYDIEVQLEGIKTLLKLYEETPTYQKLGARIPPNKLSQCDDFEFRSDNYWKCYIKQVAQSGLHGAGTCKMGNGPEDPDAVVDSSLRLIGFDNVRVVDASIMPTVIDANLHAAVYGIAEKASDVILQTWHA